MHGWLQITVAAVAVVVAAISSVVLVLLVFLFRRYSSSKQQKANSIQEPNREKTETLQTGIAKLHHHASLDLDNKRKPNYYVFRRDVSISKQLFSWADHPSLITDAVENGWSRFAFATSYTSSPSIRSTRSTLLGACAAGDRGREMEVDISWEVSPGSADFMQKIRLCSGSKKLNSNYSSMAASVIRTALPLPGPPLGTSSFPQEAYFEITILSSDEDDLDPFGGNYRKKIRKSEGEKAKLIQENYNAKADSESLIHGNKKLEEVRLGGGGRDDVKGEAVGLAVGLTRGGSLPLKLPGSYLASIGFNSDGSVYLGGTKLVFESENQEWGETNKVIGCGYNPSQRKVFFTVDSELTHVITCKSEEFGTPLYPTLAANTDTTILVNFGQSSFKYAPANAQRTPNPCFIGPLANSPALGYDDSKELFSMGRIDSQWLNRCATTRSGHNNGGNNKAFDFDEESEGDLFEIVLDSCNGRSPNTVLQ
ncbi:hypothetical protein HYC85_008440 [Camellia sinensis]|uniref:B30.2/SPRY domain-containing protein n=1 Tax=Camellia sinensis TaxID=4442 RepID=A0A7J7HU41_CAMSI|nr:hypothetical protein HYC85_008440 [Camellia sinensis]